MTEELHPLINTINSITKYWDIAYEHNLKEFDECVKEIDRRLKHYDLLKDKLIIVFQNLAILEGEVFKE